MTGFNAICLETFETNLSDWNDFFKYLESFGIV